MANNKEFVVENAIELNGPIITRKGNISSAPVKHAFRYGSYDIQEEIEWRTFFPTHTVNDTIRCHAFNDDGTILYLGVEISSNDDTTIFQYDCDIPYNMSSANTSSESSGPVLNGGNFGHRGSLVWSDDGNHYFLSQFATNFLYRWSVSTPWDVTSTISATPNQSYDIGNAGIYDFSTDGSYLVRRSSNGIIPFYYLSTPWDLTTPTFINSVDLKLMDYRDEYDTSDLGSTFGNSTFACKFINDDTQLAVITGEFGCAMRVYDLEISANTVSASYNYSRVAVEYATYTRSGTGALSYGAMGTTDFDFAITKNGTKFMTHNFTDIHVYDMNSTTHTLDLSSGEHFVIDATGQDNIVLANAVPKQSATLTVTYSGRKGWDLSYLSYDSLSIAGPTQLAQTTTPAGIHISPDGLNMYLTDTNSTIQQYALSEPWSAWNCVYVGEFIGNEIAQSDVWLSKDGTYAFSIDSSHITSYKLTEPWDITTCVEIGVRTNVSSWLGIHVSENGKRLWTTDFSSDNIREYVISTPWDASTVGIAPIRSLDVGAEGAPHSLYFSPSGLHLYATGTRQSIFEWTLTEPFNIATAGTPIERSISDDVSTYQRGLFFSNDGTRMFTSDDTETINVWNVGDGELYYPGLSQFNGGYNNSAVYFEHNKCNETPTLRKLHRLTGYGISPATVINYFEADAYPKGKQIMYDIYTEDGITFDIRENNQ